MGNKGKIRISGIAIPFEKENKNGQIYSKESFSEECLKDLNEKLKHTTLFGEATNYSDHDPSVVSLKNVAFHVDKTEINSKGLYVEGELLNTQKGKEAKKIIQDALKNGQDLPYRIASRSMGSIDEKGHITVDKILAFDLIPKHLSSFDSDIDIIE